MEAGFDLHDQLRLLAAKVQKECKPDLTEEATKHAFVLLFIKALGYDVFSPNEVIPEYIADFGQAKGEKVDYAIMKDGQPIMLIECKACGVRLEKKHLEQLARYFHMTKARLGILTNGVEYRLYSDIDQLNTLDEEPFFTFRIDQIDDQVGRELKRLTKGAFNVDELLSAARELKATRAVIDYLLKQLGSPSPDFVRLVATQVHSGQKTQQVITYFTGIVKSAFNQIISDRVQDRLQSAITLEKAESKPAVESTVGNVDSTEVRTGVETTSEEVEAYYAVKSILRDVIPAARLKLRDAKAYCSVLLDDTNRKPLCRFKFGETSRLIEFPTAEGTWLKVTLDSIDDIFRQEDKLKKAAELYVKTELPPPEIF